jgi:hypothetical protein
MRAVVTGMIGTFPIGGVAWDYGQYILGLEQLGYEVFYLEDSGYPVYDAAARTYPDDSSYGVAFLARTLDELSPGMGSRWFFRATDGSTFGMDRAKMRRILSEADLLLNVSGCCVLRDEYLEAPRKVLVDTDPGWNHFVTFPRVWERDPSPSENDVNGYRMHDYFVTYALNLGRPDCNLPDFGVVWHPTRPPVAWSRWKPEPPGTTWTTILTWKSNYHRPHTHDGQVYGAKDVEFPKIEQIPQVTGVPMELAAGGLDPPIDRWRQQGWSVVDSTSVSLTLDAYRSYVQRSRGEISVAKNAYVATRSGWFSCRSVCYLAASRPVILQDTGFSDHLPTGLGLVAFGTAEEATQAIARVEERYDEHAQAAREIAIEHFAADRVLAELVEIVGA